jgi:hypothetical protein
MGTKINGLDEITLGQISSESVRAIAKHGWNKTPFNPDLDRYRKLAILTEEIGEVAKELCELELNPGSWTPDNLVSELIQVASVAASWLECEDVQRFRPQNVPDGT